MSIVDNFHEAVNDFILKENNIISILRIIKISIESYETTFQSDPHRKENIVSGLHEFIENHGKDYGSQLQTLLDDLPIQHIYTLSTKISALQMRDSCSALSCYNRLGWYYDTTQKAAILLGIRRL